MKIYVDANPKAVAYVREDGKTKVQTLLVPTTNNAAEMFAVEYALHGAWGDGLRNIEIVSDSQLVVNQLKHNWHIKNTALRIRAVQIWNFVQENKLLVIYTWIKRELNLAGKVLG